MFLRNFLHKTTLSLLVLIFLLFMNGCNDNDTEKEKKSLFIILDGISADVLEKIDTPHIDDIIQNGSYTRAWIGGEADGYSESPTVSAVGYNHLITGVWSNKHNVYDNDIENPNYNYWNIFRLFKHNYPDKEVAIHSSWLDNRTRLVGDGLPEAGEISIDIHNDGFELDSLAFPHEEDGSHIQDIDDHVAQKAAESVRSEAPVLSWVYLWYTDSAAHRYGEDTELYDALRQADRQIGSIWEAVKYRQENHNEEWLFTITTDHGRSLPDGKHHGGQSERERTVWFVTNQDKHNLYFSSIQPSIVDFYPTLSRYLNLDIPEQLEHELDGVPMIGDISVSHPFAEYDTENEQFSISWKAWQDQGDVDILVATDNKFAEGGEDEYQVVKSVPVIDEQTTVDRKSVV